MRAVEQARPSKALKSQQTQQLSSIQSKQTEFKRMAIDFTLEQQPEETAKNHPANFATEILAPAVQKADKSPIPRGFSMMKGPTRSLYARLAMGFFLPKEYGGGSVSNVDLQIVRRICAGPIQASRPSPLVNGLGLMPVAWLFASERAENAKWIGEAT